MSTGVEYVNADEEHLEQLVRLENKIFSYDKLSKRSFRHWISADNRIFIVVLHDQTVIGYGLVILHQGTRLARLYSIAISKDFRRQGVGSEVLERLEKETAKLNRLFMRLEVAQDNRAAFHFYSTLGYAVFGSFHDYYENHQDAYRMQKRIRDINANLIQRRMRWYRQTTAFTCGPSSLLMAMGSLCDSVEFTQEEELDLWREATTIFMTSGHGGCHPVGLGIAAAKRGFEASVYLNKKGALFIEGVRDPHKKEVMTVVDSQFHGKAEKHGVNIEYQDVSQNDIARWIEQGSSVVILISTYRMDGKKAPHWVAVSAIDDQCLYVHDPDPEDAKQNDFDCQYMPIARDDFAKMSAFGKEKLRACVVISPSKR